jgi:CheY-like chemotaxis protein/tetratricopeptide (TPR) repeat protein
MRFFTATCCGIIYLLIGSYSAAATAPTNLDSLKTIANTQSGAQKATTLYALAEGLRYDNKIAEAAAYAGQSRVLAEIAQRKDIAAIALTTEGLCYKANFDYTNALKSLFEALKIHTKAQNKEGAATAKAHIGRILLLQNNVQQALVNLHEAENGLRGTAQKALFAENNRYIGEAYFQQKIYGKSKEYYKTAMDNYLEINDFSNAVYLSSLLGTISLELADTEGAMLYFNTSLDLHSTLNDKAGIATDLTQTARCFLAQGDAYQEALVANGRAMLIRQEINDAVGLAENEVLAARCWLGNNDKPKALASLQKSALLLDTAKKSSETAIIYASIAEIYATAGDFSKAYQFQQIFDANKDLAFNQEKNKALLEITTKYQSEFEAEKQIARIEVLEQEKDADRKRRGLLFLTLGLIGAVAGLLWFANKRHKRSNVLLTEKNTQIEIQKTEIETKSATLKAQNNDLEFINQQLTQAIGERDTVTHHSFENNKFLATMSREMRHAINDISGTSYLLAQENPRDDQQGRIQAIQFALNKLTVYVNDILENANIESGKLVTSGQDFDAAVVMQKTLNPLRKIVENKGAIFQTRLAASIPDKLVGDPSRLTQIVTNLVILQLKNAQANSVWVDLSVKQQAGSMVWLHLIVGGITNNTKVNFSKNGFSTILSAKKDMEQVYESEYAPLAIAKRLVDLQEGTIRCENNTFDIILPYQIPESSFLNQELSLEEIKAYTKNRHILVVEDSKINQLVVKKILSGVGAKITIANDGLEALEILETHTFDLIIMDIQMPRMNGYAAASEIRRLSDPVRRNTPILALTAAATQEEVLQTEACGMNEHLAKPFSPEALLDKTVRLFIKKPTAVNSY